MARVRFRLPFILAAGLLVNLWLTGPALGQNPLDWLFEDRRATPFRPGKAHPSHLNEGQGLQATEKGEGTLGIPGPNRRLTAATVTLSARGKAEILLTGERTYRLAGTWQRGRAQDILIDLTDTFARSPASGGGTLTLTDNASFHRIDLKGESAALGGDFNMHFEANSTAPNPRPRFSLDATENGRSSMGVSGPNRRLSQARAILERDGRARLIFRGEDIHQFSGHWSRRAPNVVDLHLTEGPDGRPMEAEASLELSDRGRGFSRIDLLGRSASLGGRVRVTFERDRDDREPTADFPRNERIGEPLALTGKGTLGVPGPNRSLESARITLDPRGDLLMDFHGRDLEDHDRFEGRWGAGSTLDQLRIAIDQVNGQPARGSGTLGLSNDGAIESLSAQGRAAAFGARTGDFDLRFQASRRAQPVDRFQRGDSTRRSALERLFSRDR